MRLFALVCFTTFLTTLFNGVYDKHPTWYELDTINKLIAWLAFLGIFASPVWLLDWFMEWNGKNQEHNR
jgi:hypothetical protein